MQIFKINFVHLLNFSLEVSLKFKTVKYLKYGNSKKKNYWATNLIEHEIVGLFFTHYVVPKPTQFKYF